MSEPVASDPAGMLMMALPPVKAVDAEAYPPPVSVTEPVGVGLPPPPLTAMVTVKPCALVMLLEDGVTVTVGIIVTGTITVTEFEPVAPLYVAELAASGV
jgi:hypothetical protein